MWEPVQLGAPGSGAARCVREDPWQHVSIISHAHASLEGLPSYAADGCNAHT